MAFEASLPSCPRHFDTASPRTSSARSASTCTPIKPLSPATYARLVSLVLSRMVSTRRTISARAVSRACPRSAMASARFSGGNPPNHDSALDLLRFAPWGGRLGPPPRGAPPEPPGASKHPPPPAPGAKKAAFAINPHLAINRMDPLMRKAPGPFQARHELAEQSAHGA